MKGVNYGNRFTPEAWMNIKSWTHEDFDSIFGPKYGPPNVTAPHEGEEPSLCDVPDSRILNWLNDTIEEEDFRKMKEYGVKLLRLPTGYFNWVDKMPEVPDDVAPRIRNLQNVKPSQYEPYIDRIFHYARQYDIQLFPELHGAPGSQNSSPHTGCALGESREPGEKNNGYFAPPNRVSGQVDTNMRIALDVMAKMAEKCFQFEGTCWGIGTINEPQGNNRYNTPWMQTYFTEAILTVRQTLPKDFPVVLFSWPKDFTWWWKFQNKTLTYDTYGKVMWDTHLYTSQAGLRSNNVDEVLSFYEKELDYVRDFRKKTGTEVIVGEFSLSNYNGTMSPNNPDWQEYADRVFPLFEEAAGGGALLWNFDCASRRGWSMERLAEEVGINWNL